MLNQHQTKEQEAEAIAKNLADWYRYVNFVCEKSIFEKLEEELAFAPASTNRGYVSAYPGGLLEHLLRTMNLAMRIHAATGPSQKTHTETQWNQLKFSILKIALLHDLGKLGVINGTKVTSYYLPVSERWKNERGFYYDINPAVSQYTVSDITLHNLSALNIVVSLSERDAINSINGRHTERLDNPPVTDNWLAVILQAAVKLSCLAGKNSQYATQVIRDKQDTNKTLNV